MERVFSGVQPSGVLHLGNYLGAIKNWLDLQNDYQCIFCVVDLHAITVPQDPKELLKKTMEVAKIYLAAGIDPKKSIIFVQSHIKEHVELAWLLNTITKISELEKMTQFKEKTGIASIKKIHDEVLERMRGLAKTKSSLDKEILALENLSNRMANDNQETHNWSKEVISILSGLGKIINIEIEEKNILADSFKNYMRINEQYAAQEKAGVGLFDYPVLMAADILLYQTAVVPVGEDQVQHIELARDLAQRFNNKFGEVFVVPKPLVRKEGARIMGLDDPTKKMSKSAPSAHNYIALTDSPALIREKIKKAVTDSGKEIKYEPEKPALSNLLTIYSLLTDKPVVDLELKYKNKSYADFKNDLAEVVVDFLGPFQKRYNALDDNEVLQILHDGASQVQTIAQETMAKVKKAMGLIS
ncbi:MAG TPA: tryptophan--tRNA ligase [Candidatus Portnoybacteria bacterium]|nr:tryptophan--tRNA ligase [Candidatus Portnoybacteria bacterium]